MMITRQEFEGGSRVNTSNALTDNVTYTDINYDPNYPFRTAWVQSEQSIIYYLHGVKRYGFRRLSQEEIERRKDTRLKKTIVKHYIERYKAYKKETEIFEERRKRPRITWDELGIPMMKVY